MSCKEPGRDYATTAFIQYAALGRPTRNQQEEKIKSEIHQRLAFEEPGFIVVRAAAALTEREGLLSDIDAVNRVISTLQREGKGYIVDAIEAVYFPMPDTSTHVEQLRRVCGGLRWTTQQTRRPCTAG